MTENPVIGLQPNITLFGCPGPPGVVWKPGGTSRSEAGLDRAKQAFEQEKARKAAVAQLKFFPTAWWFNSIRDPLGIGVLQKWPPFKGGISDKPNVYWMKRSRLLNHLEHIFQATWFACMGWGFGACKSKGTSSRFGGKCCSFEGGGFVLNFWTAATKTVLQVYIFQRTNTRKLLTKHWEWWSNV